MASTETQLQDAEKMMVKADKMTRLSLTRWKADWRNATLLYEKAALTFRHARAPEKAKEAFVKAARGHEMLSSPWDAAKHMESAAALAKEVGNWGEVSDFYRRASEYYTECGRSQPATDALAKGARLCALEEAVPEDAIQMYADACTIFEEDEKMQMTFDLYRSAMSLYIKLDRFSDAAAFLLRWGLAADKCKAVNCQCKAYLSAIIVCLYAHDFQQAQNCYNDCAQIDAFISSDQNRCAEKLLSAYAEADQEEIKRITLSSTISNLDHVIIRLARKLPTGDLSSLNTDPKEDETLDENDLT
ncbi:unnamed protein product [Victoria cruziana]